ncbi:MAG: PilZ domain-containing protein [Deltaproteobacteria bacterium]|nr:PilZ domain-containing protein [Deltaproteobacteria bacterium]
MDTDRRRHPRYDIMAQVRVLRGTVNYILDVSNISVVGLFVSTAGLPRMPWFRAGQRIELDVFTPEELENIRVFGRIVRLEEGVDGASRGFGVQFVDVDKDTQIKIDRLVELAKVHSIQPPPLPGMGPGGNGD